MLAKVKSLIWGVMTFALISLVPTLAHAAVLWVSLDGSALYSDIQSAVNAAQNGDEIRIVQGTYTSNNPPDLSESMVYIYGKTLSLIGGFPFVGSTKNDPELYPTVIDNEYVVNRRCISINGAYAINNVYLYGLTFTRGGGPPGTTPQFIAGGVYNFDSNLKMEKCKFTFNHADGGSPAFAADAVSRPIIVEISKTKFMSNGTLGSAAVNVYGFVRHYVPMRITLQITDSIFQNNKSRALSATDADVVITNSIFDSNTSSNSSGEQYGGAVWLRGSTAKIQNCTFYNNVAGSVFPGVIVNTSQIIGGELGWLPGILDIRNSILRDGGGEIVTEDFGYPGNAQTSVSFSNVEGGYEGDHNIDADPLFVSAGDPNAFANDLRLRRRSPSIDSGDSLWAPLADILGVPRPQDGDGDGIKKFDFDQIYL